MFCRLTALVLLCLVTACGSLPRPFEGHPGANATRLLQPPPVRLVVARPINALLSDEAGAQFGRAMATALADKDVPAIATTPRPGDWKLELTAELQGTQVLPLFTVIDAKGEQAGVAQGQPVDAQAWAAGASATLQGVATSQAQSIADLLTRIEAARNAQDPNSLVNRPARVVIPDVTGAPGDGNLQLAKQMRTRLSQFGMIVQDSQGDYSITGHVTSTPSSPSTTTIEIKWVIGNPRCVEGDCAELTQLNDVPTGSLDRYWGDVAVVVAQEVAPNVRDVIARLTGPASK